MILIDASLLLHAYDRKSTQHEASRTCPKQCPPAALGILRGLMREGQVNGPLVSDAALAAIALERGAVLRTTDRDFSRFPGLRWVNPFAAESG